MYVTGPVKAAVAELLALSPGINLAVMTLSTRMLADGTIIVLPG